jgi:ketosteroid isomerase-like protein
MASENVEAVDRILAAWNRADVDGFLSWFDPDCEVVFRPEVPEPGPFRGRDALRGWVEGFLSAWESYSAEIVEAGEPGETFVAVAVRLEGTGQGSDIAVEQTDWHVFEFREGRVLRWQNVSTREEALEAAKSRDRAG